MPHYFFKWLPSELGDENSEEYEDDEAAKREAIAIARELARSRLASTDERIVATGENGRFVHEVALGPGRPRLTSQVNARNTATVRCFNFPKRLSESAANHVGTIVTLR
jgi:hypothetical protein